MKFKAGIKGLSPLKMNKIVLGGDSLRKVRTDKDLIEDAKKRMYFDEEFGFYVPSTAVRLSIVGGAKKIKSGRAFFSTTLRPALRIEETKLPLGIKRWEDILFIQEFHNVQKARIVKAFGTFPEWSLSFTGYVFVDVDSELIKKAIELGGIYEGLLDGRPGKGYDFGRYELTSFEVLEEPK